MDSELQGIIGFGIDLLRAGPTAPAFQAAAPVWPPVLYGALVVLLIGGLVLVSHLLGERHSQRDRNVPYESGALPAESARIRFHAQYYLVAVLFLLFDMEGVFLFGWAIAFRRLAWGGYLAALLFIVTLAFGLIYIWKEGALDWNRPAEWRRDDERESLLVRKRGRP